MADGNEKWAAYMAQRRFEHVFQSAAMANGNGEAMDIEGVPGTYVRVEGIVEATVNFEGMKDGSAWCAIRVLDSTLDINSDVIVLRTLTDGLFWVPPGGLKQLRCRISEYSAGTIDVQGLGTEWPSNSLRACPAD